MWGLSLLDEAEGWLRRAAEGGHVPAMAELPDALAYRAFYEGPLQEALEWYHRGVEAGDAEAIHGLAAHYERRGQDEDAEQWYQRAYAAGHAATKTEFGALLLQRGRPKDAARWWQAAADEGDAAAQHNLGVLAEKRGQPAEAEASWRQAAAGGHPGAIHRLGTRDKERRRPDDAESWWRRTAAAGHADAMKALAMRCRDQGRTDQAEDRSARRRSGTSGLPKPATSAPWAKSVSCSTSTTGWRTRRTGTREPRRVWAHDRGGLLAPHRHRRVTGQSKMDRRGSRKGGWLLTNPA